MRAHGAGRTCEVGAARPNELHSTYDAGRRKCRSPVPSVDNCEDSGTHRFVL